MGKIDKETLDGARAEIKEGLAAATPGEAAIAGLLTIISLQLDAIYAQQERALEWTHRVEVAS